MAQYLKNLPVGSLIKLGAHQVGSETKQDIIWVVADKTPANHSGYPADSITLITKNIIDLRAYDGYEDTRDGNSYENNSDYGTSAINQWLNSSAKSNWFVKSNSRDNPPSNDVVTDNTGYSSRPGFLYNFDEGERLAILPTILEFPREGSTSSFNTVTSKVFLPSVKEILGTSAVADKTTRLQYFSSSDVTSILTSQAYENTPSSTKPADKDSSWKYFTRNTSYSSVYGISHTGGTMYLNTNEGSAGIRPMINISVNTKVSDKAGDDGCYEWLPQTPPTIDGTNKDLGSKNEGFKQEYAVNDTDEGDTVVVREYIDNVLIRSHEVTLNEKNYVAIEDETWFKLANGIHTIDIVATDGIDEVTRTYTFTKSVTKLVVQRSTPILCDTEPKSTIITVVKVIPQEAIFKVEVCRNGFDTEPYWEDITSKVINGKIHEFDTDHTKANNTNWGINVRVTVDRNGGVGACYIKEIGGNWE